MAVLVVQVGQCGNQLGDELFTQLCIATHRAPRPSSFFARDGKARCVLVDSEPKVVQGVYSRHAEVLRRENVVCGQSGRGNNWGLGYYGVADPYSAGGDDRVDKLPSSHRAFKNLHKNQRVADDGLLAKALRAIWMETRRTVDMDAFEVIVLIHSLAGGTGSGLASRLAEKIRYYFIQTPDTEWDEVEEEQSWRQDGLDGMLVEKRRAQLLLCIAVAPQRAGELATQGINTALTLHVLHKCADAVVLLRNDDAMTPQASASTKSSSSSPPPRIFLRRCDTFKETNEVFVALLLPIFCYGASVGCVRAFVHQCVPEAPVAGAASPCPLTGGNNILTLVPIPQSSYEAWRHVALRFRFYALQGCAKMLLPGCQPAVPWQTMLAASALRRGGSRATGSDACESRRIHTTPRGACRRSAEAQSDNEEDNQHEYVEVGVQPPPALLDYYAQFARSPVAVLARSLEGVALLNQVRELDAAVVLPLLRSAALKAKVGAFMHLYARVGVSRQHIEAAYHHVAELHSRAEDL